MSNREEIAKEHNMSMEFVNWFFDTKKDGCGNAWFMMMAAMWESWKHLAEQRDHLAAENAALTQFIEADCWVIDPDRDAYIDAAQCVPETPTSDAWQREQMAKGVDAFGRYHNFSEKRFIQKEAQKFAAQLRNGEAV